MKPFEYANPSTEAEALELMNEHGGNTAVLAGGTDLLNLLNRNLAGPARVVDVKNIESLQGIQPDGDGILVGALVSLEDLAEHSLAADYRSLLDVVDGVRSIQVQSMGTVGGDLCHLPNCWYFRNGYGLLGIQGGKSLVEAGDNRYHAIFGNRGPAKFVSASRFAPAMVAWGASVRIIGPEPGQETWLPLEHFYITPKTESHGVTVLKKGQLITHLRLPAAAQVQSATYDVLQGEGLDWPLASAAVCVDVEGGRVRQARIVMGHVAPMPWVAEGAAKTLLGQPVNAETAGRAADVAVAGATPLSQNQYKVQLARTAVKRALLRAVGQPEGGL